MTDSEQHISHTSGDLLAVTPARSWVALISLGLVLLVGVLWGFFGSIPTTVGGQGIIMPPGGLSQLKADKTGVFNFTAPLQTGDTVKAGQVLATITVRGEGKGKGLTTQVLSNQDGILVEVLAGRGETVVQGQPLFILTRGGGRLIAVIYLPHMGHADRVQIGARAEISLVAYEKERFGYLIGRVSHVSPYPVSTAGMEAVIGNHALVAELMQEGAPVEVRVELEEDGANAGGYRWSSTTGNAIKLTQGSWCTGSFEVERVRPISLIFPLLKELLPQ